MTDYYVRRSYEHYGPYSLDRAREVAAWLAHPDGGDEKDVSILSETEIVRPSTDVYNDGEMYPMYEDYFDPETEVFGYED